MRRLTYILLALSFFLVSCNKDDGPAPIAKRTTLIYMAADNDLSSYAESNTEVIINAYKKLPSRPDTHLLIYKDTPNAEPQLLYIDQNGSRIIKEYTGHISSSSSSLSTAIRDIVTLFPANTYSLVLWSHGTGWIPQEFPLVAKSAKSRPYQYPPTKTFGLQVVRNTTYEIEIDELKTAIPSGTFDFILFDACYMGAVEVVYALKDKADYIISSPCEVIADGFPYHNITLELTSESQDAQNLSLSIAKKYFNYYNQHSIPSYRYATVSVVRTSKLDALCASVKKIIHAHRNDIDILDVNITQTLDAYNHHFIYDLDSFISPITYSNEYSEFSNALGETVIYSAHTPYMFDIPLNIFCGLSTYIPFPTSVQRNQCYKSTDWYRATYP